MKWLQLSVGFVAGPFFAGRSNEFNRIRALVKHKKNIPYISGISVGYMQLCVLKITEGSSKDPRFCYIVYDCHLMSLNCDLLGLYSNVIACDL